MGVIRLLESYPQVFAVIVRFLLRDYRKPPIFNSSKRTRKIER